MSTTLPPKQKVPWFVAVREENTQLRARVSELEDTIMHFIECEKYRTAICEHFRELVANTRRPWTDHKGGQS